MENEFIPHVFGRDYVLLDWIATGGMAEIYCAAHRERLNPDDLLVIKRLLPKFSTNKQFITMLEAEAKICSLLNHPNIARVFDLASWGQDFFIVMELVHGISLDRLTAELRSRGQRLNPGVAILIIHEMGRGLDYAHAFQDTQGRPLNLVHRDVTPGNILLSFDGFVRLTDFGIATAAQSKVHGGTLAMGKLPYMAPEQVRNQAIDAKADVYAAGVLLFELLTGRPPFLAKRELELQELILRKEPPKLSEFRNEFGEAGDTYFSRVLAKEPGVRPKNIKELVEGFSSIALPAKVESLSKILNLWFKDVRDSRNDAILNGLKVAPKLFAEFDHEAKVNASKQVESQGSKTQFIPKESEDAATQFRPKSKQNKSVKPKKATEVKNLPSQEPKQEIEREASKEVKDGVDISHPDFAFDVPEGAQESLEDNATKLEQRAPVWSEVEPKKSEVGPEELINKKNEIGKIELASHKQRQEFLENLDPEFGHSDSKNLDGTPAEEPAPEKEDPVLAHGVHAGIELEDSGEDLDLERPEPIEDPEAPSNLPELAQNEVEQSEEFIKPEPVEIPKRSAPIEAEIPVVRRQGRFRLWLLRFLLLVVFVGGCLAAALLLSKTLKFDRESVKGTFIDDPKIYLFLFAEKPETSREEKVLGRFLAPPKLKEEASIKALTRFFNSEYARIVGSKDLKVSISLQGPFFVKEPAPTKNPLFKHTKTYDFFFVNTPDDKRIRSESLRPQDRVIYVYFYREPLGTRRDYPMSYYGFRRPKEGIVFLPLVRDSIGFSKVNLAFEILTVYGANVKFNDFGTPEFPQGYANPLQSPLYPQERAEIMARTIPLGTDATRPVKSITEVVIGHQTAFEIGWISEENRNLFYSKLR